MKQTPREALAKSIHDSLNGDIKWELRTDNYKWFYYRLADNLLALTGTTEDGIKWRMGAYREDGAAPEPVKSIMRNYDYEKNYYDLQDELIKAGYVQKLEE